MSITEQPLDQLEYVSQEVERLCIDGTDEQRSAFKTIDTLSKRDAAYDNLLADDERAVRAGAVCKTCVQQEVCAQKAESFVADRSVELPRPLNHAGVVGNRLITFVGNRPAVEEISDEPAVHDFSGSVVLEELVRKYDGRAQELLEEGVERGLYGYITTGVISEEMRIQVARIAAVEQQNRAARQNRNPKGQKRSTSGAGAVSEDGAEKYTLPCRKTLDAALDHPLYLSDRDMQKRFSEVSSLLSGYKVPLVDGLEQVMQVEKTPASATIAQEYEQKVLSEGLCKNTDNIELFARIDAKSSRESRAICFACPAFAACGVKLIANPNTNRTSRILAAMSSRTDGGDIRAALGGIEVIKAAKKRADFAAILEQVHKVFADEQAKIAKEQASSQRILEDVLGRVHYGYVQSVQQQLTEIFKPVAAAVAEAQAASTDQGAVPQTPEPAL